MKFKIIERGHGIYKYPVKIPMAGKKLKQLEDRGEKLYTKDEADKIIRDAIRRKR